MDLGVPPAVQAPALLGMRVAQRLAGLPFAQPARGLNMTSKKIEGGCLKCGWADYALIYAKEYRCYEHLHPYTEHLDIKCAGCGYIGFRECNDAVSHKKENLRFSR